MHKGPPEQAPDAQASVRACPVRVVDACAPQGSMVAPPDRKVRPRPGSQLGIDEVTLIEYMPPLTTRAVPESAPPAPPGLPAPAAAPEPSVTSAPPAATPAPPEGRAAAMAAPVMIAGGRANTAVFAVSSQHAPEGGLAPDPRRNLFRERALHAYLRGADVATVLRVAGPSTWLILLALASLVLSAAAFVAVGRVDLTGKGPGVLRVPGGVLELNARVPGTVSRVYVHSGQRVKRGETLLTLDDTQLKASYDEAQKRLRFVEHELEKLLTQSRETSERSEKLLRREARLARKRLRVQHESNEQIGAQLAPMRELSEKGMVARMESDEVEERLRTGVRTQLSLHEDLLRIEERIASLALEEDTQRYHWESERQAARASVQAAEVALRDAVVQAPTDGVIEAVMVQPGELLRPGALVGKILPSGVPSQVVGFVPERDRAFLKPGDVVRLDVAQLPAAEFGTARAHVRRISHDLAAAEEVAEALGPSYELHEPHYRVEMELSPDTKPALRDALRPGMLVEAKFVLRRRLLLALLFDPVRRWVE